MVRIPVNIASSIEKSIESIQSIKNTKSNKELIVK